MAKLAALLSAAAAERAAMGDLQALPTEPAPKPEEPPLDTAAFIAEVTAKLAGIKPLTPEETRARDFALSISPRLKEAGFSDRYRVDALLDGPDPRCAEQRAVLAKIRGRFIRQGAIVALVGHRGTGKTSIAAQLAAVILWEFLAIAQNPAGRPVPCPVVHYHKLTALIGKLKALYADFGTIDTDRLETFRDILAACDLLVIDELQEATAATGNGTEIFDSKHKDKILTDLLDRRYSARLDTLLITNQTAENFEATINPSIASRLQEHGGIIPCDWESFREAPATPLQRP